MKLSLLLSCLFITSMCFAQTHLCWPGWQQSLMTQRLQNNLANLDVDAPTYRDTRFVPIQFHLVANDGGTGRVEVTDVLDQLCRLNQDFLDHDIQFFLKDELNFIDADDLFEYAGYPDELGDAIMQSEEDPNAINVFIIKELGPSFFIPSTYVTLEDWILVNQNYIDGEGVMLSHQMGHFFSLLHTFQGWPGPYNESEYGQQAPATTPNGNPVELVDQSNCETAGDFLCDTPADYWFIQPFADCRYVGNVTDANGDPVDPDEELIMSFYFDCNRDDYYFSPMQSQVMNADLDTPDRAYLQVSPSGITDPIVGTPELLTPLNGETLGGTMVEFSWTPVENAEAYLLEISRSPNFGLFYVGLVIYGTSLLANNLTPDATYFWRVRPYNSYDVCQPPSAYSSFETGVELAQNDLSTPEFWSVFPNPATDFLKVSTYHLREANYQILSAAGQVVMSGDHFRKEIQIDVSALDAGIYFIQLETPAGISTKRFLRR